MDLIKQMLTVDRNKRLKGEQCLAHPWFEKCIKKKEGLQIIHDEEVLKKLKAFKGSSTLKKAALNILVKMLSTKDVEDLR